MARGSIATQTKGWIETLISFMLAVSILMFVGAGIYYLFMVV